MRIKMDISCLNRIEDISPSRGELITAFGTEHSRRYLSGEWVPSAEKHIIGMCNVLWQRGEHEDAIALAHRLPEPRRRSFLLIAGEF